MASPHMIEAYRYTKNIDSWSGGLPTTVTEIYIPSLKVIVDSDGFCSKTNNFSEHQDNIIKMDFPEDLGKRIALFANNLFQNFEDERLIIQVKLWPFI
jgi:hypothetical protein